MKHPVKNLINKLSGREKAYFKKLNSDSGTAKFVKLYLFLTVYPEATVEGIKNEFKGTSIALNPHVELNYLYQHLLRTLHVFHLRKNSLTRLLSFAEILIEKKEFKQASKVVQKLKKKAYQEEELEFILNAINLEGKIKDVAITIRSIEDLNDEYEERSRILTEIQNTTKLKKLKLELLNIHYNYIFNRVEMVDKFNSIEDALDLIQQVPFTFLGKDIWFSVNNLFNQTKKDYEQAQLYALKRLDNIQLNKTKMDSLDQLKAFNNYLFITILRKDYSEFNDKYKQLLAFEKSDEVSKHKFLYFKIYLKLAIEVNMNHQDLLVSLLPRAIDESEPILELISPSERNELLQFLTSACLLTSNYKKAQQILILWGQYPVKGYTFLIFKLNKMITFLGQGNLGLLKYEVENFKKLIENSDYKNDTYAVLMQLFKKAVSEQGIKQKDIGFFIEKIKTTRKSTNRFFEYYELDYVNWLKTYQDSFSNPNEEF